MSTKNLICVLYKGRFFIAQYCKWDGYPYGQGVEILKFLLIPGNIKRLEKGLEHIYVLSREQFEGWKGNYQGVVPAVRELLQQTPARYLEDQIVAQYFSCLSQDIGAKILKVVPTATAKEKLPIGLSPEFANNGLCCEWAYVVNLNDRTLEVFAGSERKDTARSRRFNEVGDENDSVLSLCKSIPFDELSTDEDVFVDSIYEAYRKRQRER